MKILVIGGAGYIGSHMVKLLSEKSCDLTILDDLSTGHASSVLAGELVIGNFGNSKLLDSLLCKHFDVIMHFAAFSQVEGSVLNPGDYYQNNVLNSNNEIPVLTYWYSGKSLYCSNTAIHDSLLIGGNIPMIGRQSTIDKPEPVSRVTPPSKIIPNIVTAQATSHITTARFLE